MHAILSVKKQLCLKNYYAYCMCVGEMELREDVKAASVNLLDIYDDCYVMHCQVLVIPTLDYDTVQCL